MEKIKVIIKGMLKILKICWVRKEYLNNLSSYNLNRL